MSSSMIQQLDSGATEENSNQEAAFSPMGSNLKSDNFPNNKDLNVAFSKNSHVPLKANVFNFETSSFEKINNLDSPKEFSNFHELEMAVNSRDKGNNVVSIILSP